MIAAQGNDINGEARLIDAMVERNSRILDAGCGTGRLGGYLVERGHEVVGTDIDPILIEHARTDFAGLTSYVGDLGSDPIPEGDFDLAVSAGNVMGFIAESDRGFALRNIYDAMVSGGRFVVGFGAGRGWRFDDFIDSATTTTGFVLENRFSSWDLKPYSEDATYLVAVLRKP